MTGSANIDFSGASENVPRFASEVIGVAGAEAEYGEHGQLSLIGCLAFKQSHLGWHT